MYKHGGRKRGRQHVQTTPKRAVRPKHQAVPTATTKVNSNTISSLENGKSHVEKKQKQVDPYEKLLSTFKNQGYAKNLFEQRILEEEGLDVEDAEEDNEQAEIEDEYQEEDGAEGDDFDEEGAEDSESEDENDASEDAELENRDDSIEDELQDTFSKESTKDEVDDEVRVEFDAHLQSEFSTNLCQESITPSLVTHSKDLYIRKFPPSHELSPQAMVQIQSNKVLTKLPSIPGLKESIFGSGLTLENNAAASDAGSSKHQDEVINKNRKHESVSEIAAEGDTSLETILQIPSLGNPDSFSLTDCHVDPRLVTVWRSVVSNPQHLRNKSEGLSKATVPENGDHRLYADDMPNMLQRSIFGLCSSYRDILFTSRTVANSNAVLQGVCLHLVNHLFKSLTIVSTHDNHLEQLKKEHEEKMKEKKIQEVLEAEKKPSKSAKRKRANKRDLSKEDDTALELPEYRDQGFTRCKILVLLPVAAVAHRFLQVLLSLLPAKYARNIQNWNRWQTEFAPPEEEEAMDPKYQKPIDFRHLFEGQTSDAFRVGVQFNKGKMKLYSSFYESDMIIASPLGLRMIIGNELETKREIDFLSSVEIVFADLFHVFSMQNIEHVDTLFQSLNCTPYAAHNADFSRIREWNLNGHGRYYRQNIFLSDYSTPDCLRIFNANCFNSYGKLQIRSLYDGQLGRVLTSVRQYFTRIEVTSLQSAANERFQYFVDSVLPQLRSRTFASEEGHLLLFIPSYFDYVRIRNICKERKISFCNACEYTRPQEISRSRSAFFHGETKVLLFTERFHFFRRYAIRGVHHVIFFGLPANAHFYTEVVNWCESESKGTVIALYTRHESNELERIVGSKFAYKMLQSTQLTHTFT